MLSIADVIALSTAVRRQSQPHTAVLDAARGLAIAAETARERGRESEAARYAELSQSLYADSLAAVPLKRKDR